MVMLDATWLGMSTLLPVPSWNAYPRYGWFIPCSPSGWRARPETWKLCIESQLSVLAVTPEGREDDLRALLSPPAPMMQYSEIPQHAYVSGWSKIY